MICDVCESDNQSRHFDLYVFGSEGVILCLQHQIKVGNFIRELTHEKMKEKRDAVLKRKQAAEEAVSDG
jgi:hypothetical protein